MIELSAKPSQTQTLRRRGQKRLWVLVGCLVAVFSVHTVVSLNPRFLGDDWGTDRTLDRCITEESVLKFLDGKSVLSGYSMHPSASGLQAITLHKEKISSLVIRPDDWSMILVRFNLDHEGKQYRVEGSFQFTTSDSPDLHYHGWDRFMGQVGLESLTRRPGGRDGQIGELRALVFEWAFASNCSSMSGRIAGTASLAAGEMRLR